MSDRPLSGRPLPSSFDDTEDFYNESGFQKVLRRLKEEPLVPFGCILTIAAFTSAYRAMRRGDHHKVQRMFRARVAAQGFTVLAMVAGGMYYAEDRKKQKEVWKLKQQQEAEEKRQKWIKELEARDEEDKAFREFMEKKRKRAAERTTIETGSEGVAAQARAALRVAKAAKGDLTADTTESPGQSTDSKNESSTGVLGSLGGWFGGSNKTPQDPARGSSDPKPNPADGQK